MIYLLILIILLLILIIRNIVIVPQARRFRGGTAGRIQHHLAGRHPCQAALCGADRQKVNLKEQVADFEPQPVITRIT